MLIKFSSTKGLELTEQNSSFLNHDNYYCFCLQVVEDMLEDEEEEDDRDDKVIIFPSTWVSGEWENLDMTLFLQTVKKGVEVF